MPVKQRFWLRPVPASSPIATRPALPLTNQWRTSLWEDTPTCRCPPISSKVWRRAQSSTRRPILLVSPCQVGVVSYSDSTWRNNNQLKYNPDVLPITGGQMDFSHVSAPLMTPPISPAALVHRGSVINQGPMAGRPLTSSSSSSLSCPSSSSSHLSLGVLTNPSPCSSFPETLYNCLPHTSANCFPAASGSSTSGYQPALRSHDVIHSLMLSLQKL